MRRLADVAFGLGGYAAAILSVTFQSVCTTAASTSNPSLSEAAYGITSDMLTRAADVVLQERRAGTMVACKLPS